MPGEVYDIFVYIMFTCDDEASVSAAECVTHIKGLQATAAFILEVRGVNFITSTLKSRNSVVASTVTVTILSCTLVQEPM